jgi:hypothetical protein
MCCSEQQSALLLPLAVSLLTIHFGVDLAVYISFISTDSSKFYAAILMLFLMLVTLVVVAVSCIRLYDYFVDLNKLKLVDRCKNKEVEECATAKDKQTTAQQQQQLETNLPGQMIGDNTAAAAAEPPV